jgi:branched-chain amino acid transport system substrate-binding protein
MSTPIARRRRVLPFLLVALAMTAAACGGHLSDAEVRAASGVPNPGPTVSSADGAGGPTAPGPRDAPVTTTEAAAVPGAGSGTAAASTTVAPAAKAAGTPGETGPIVIGSVGTYSGPAGSSTSAIPKAVQVWAASVNARGGLLGRQVQVVVQDDGGDPARYASAVQDLVENRHVVAFVGQASLGMSAGTAYLQRKGIPVIGTDCSLAAWYSSPVYFPQCANLGDPSTGITFRLARKVSDKHRLGIVYCSESPACSDSVPSLERAAAANGVQVVYKAQVSLAQIDYTANCQAARDKQADLFLVAGDPNTVERFARSCDRQAYHPQFVQPSVTISAKSREVPGLGDMIVVSQVFPFSGAASPAAKEFQQALARFAPKDQAGPAHAYGWAAAKLFELAATRAAQASHSLTPATLIKAMHTIKGETLGGLTTTLDFSGPTPRNAPCQFGLRAGPQGWTTPFGTSPTC